MATDKMPANPNDINEALQYSAMGGAIGAMAKSLKTKGIVPSLVDAVVGGAFTVSTCGAMIYFFATPNWVIVSASCSIGVASNFFVNWGQRLTGSLLFFVERLMWRDYNRKADGDPPPDED